jgi:hypothetical protein
MAQTIWLIGLKPYDQLRRKYRKNKGPKVKPWGLALIVDFDADPQSIPKSAPDVNDLRLRSFVADLAVPALSVVAQSPLSTYKLKRIRPEPAGAVGADGAGGMAP